MQVGRALRSEHARARSAYPRDPLSLRSTRRTRLSHPAASPRVHRSNLLYALARCSSSARTQRLLRSCAPVPWSHATMLGGSDDFSLRCSRSCAEHYVGCSHFEARAPLCACGLCRVRSIRWSACGTLNARSRWSCGVSPWSWAVRMRSRGAARDGVRYVWRFARIVERRRRRCASVACGCTRRWKVELLKPLEGSCVRLP